MPSGSTGKPPGKDVAAQASSTAAPDATSSTCGKAAPAISAEEQKALDQLGPLGGKSQSDIEAQLLVQGYTGVKANSGGKVFTKDLGNGKTMAVRLDPAMQRNPPKGFADEKPHAHKESVPSAAVSNGNYSPTSSGLTKFDDLGKPSSDPGRVHIPTQ